MKSRRSTPARLLTSASRTELTRAQLQATSKGRSIKVSSHERWLAQRLSREMLILSAWSRIERDLNIVLCRIDRRGGSTPLDRSIAQRIRHLLEDSL